MAQACMSGSTETEVTIHYLRPGFELPGLDEVKKCQEMIGEAVYKLSPTVLVKHDSTTNLLEINNMLFIEQHTSIPIAKLQAAYSTRSPEYLYHPADGGEPELRRGPDYYYLFMYVVPGVTLRQCWDHWDDATKLNVQNELTDYIRQLRGLSGGGYIGTLDRGPITDGILLEKTDNMGPFDTEAEFNHELRKTYVKSYKREALIAERLDGLLAVHKHKIAFTHNDLHPSNILVHDGHISAVIDWADSGWYPDYWEYISAMRTMNQRADWNTILDAAMGRPHCEFLMIEKLRTVLHV